MSKLLLFVLFGCNMAIFSWAGNDVNVMGILEKANGVKANSSYKATLSVWPNQEDKLLYYQKANPDGTVWTRREKIKKSRFSPIFINNDAGSFEVIGNTAIKREDARVHTLLSPIKVIRKSDDVFIVDGKEITREIAGNEIFARLALMADGKNLYPSNAECVDINYNGIPCYLIKMKSEVTPKTANQNKNTMSDEQGKPLGNVDYSQRIPALTEYIIGKKDFFIYSYRNINSEGKLLSEIKYADVVFNPSFDDTFFALPQNANIMIVKTSKEHAAAVVQAFKNTRSIKK